MERADALIKIRELTAVDLRPLADEYYGLFKVGIYLWVIEDD